MSASANNDVKYPRVSITFCTKCKWNLRAAWYLQELLSTFGNDLGEVALIPGDAGVFQVHITLSGRPPVLLWDRVLNDGFPDSKDLKRLVRNHIDPTRDLGHVDKHQKGSESKKVQDKECVECKEIDSASDTL